MVNKNYLKGRRKEYSITEKYKKLGFKITQRTAGSHSVFDVIAINKETKEIKLIQSKPNNFSQAEENKILDNNDWLNGNFQVEFIVM